VNSPEGGGVKNFLDSGAHAPARGVRAAMPRRGRARGPSAAHVSASPRRGSRAPGMGMEQEVRVLWDRDGRNPNRSDKGAGEGRGQGGPRGGVWWKSKVECQTERKQSVVEATVTVGELATSSRPVSVGAARGRDAGVGTKFCVLTRGGLWASAHGR